MKAFDRTSLLLAILLLASMGLLTQCHAQEQPTASTQISSSPQEAPTPASEATLLSEWILSNRQMARSTAAMVQAINVLIQRIGALEFRLNELEREITGKPITDTEVESAAQPGGVPSSPPEK